MNPHTTKVHTTVRILQGKKKVSTEDFYYKLIQLNEI